jgi:hypothetical protein
MTHHRDSNDDDTFLESLLESEGAKPQPVPSDLMARVLADAAAAQPRAFLRAHRARPRLRDVLADLFGGRAGLAGLGLASGLGLFLGFAQPIDLLSDSIAFELIPATEGLIALLDAGA